MSYRIVFFCPDSHIRYNIHTLDRTGVGGGVTARVRMAHALAARGHKVQLFVNCPANETLSGVQYSHFSEMPLVDTDVFVATTSGGEMDLSALHNDQIQARLKILFVHGDPIPKGFERIEFDFIYAPSNYIAWQVISTWGMEPKRIFVSHHGIEERFFMHGNGKSPARDDFRILYAGHPAKGLDTALAVLQMLRKDDQRYSLHIFGGYQLWGQAQEVNIHEAGVFFHGLVGQEELAKEMMSSGFSLNLQAREEPFGMVITESQRAGCIVLASPVGAYPEIIRDGYDGFLIPGNHEQQDTREKAANLIVFLNKNADYREYVRKNATQAPLDWDLVAKAWEGHWANFFSGRTPTEGFLFKCPVCGGEILPLADGLHCRNCSRYQQYCQV